MEAASRSEHDSFTGNSLHSSVPLTAQRTKSITGIRYHENDLPTGIGNRRLFVPNRFAFAKHFVTRSERMLKMFFRIPNLQVCALLATALICVQCGCGSKTERTEERPSPSIHEQVLAVQQGDSREIRSYVPIDEAGFEQLRGLLGLEVLSLTHADVSDEIADVLSSLEGLRQIRLEKAPIGDQSARAIGNLPKLSSINLPNCIISDEGIKDWPLLNELVLLRIGSPNLSDSAIETVAKMTSLRFLHLIDVPITDVGLTHLYGMEHLESFYLDGDRVTEDGLTALLEAMPKLHFHRDQQHLPIDPRANDHGKH